MSLSEFKLIDHFFNTASNTSSTVNVGIGDDCAVVTIPDGQQIAISTDTLVEGVHFLADSEPELLGHKVLAVNLSDLAAMGAKPAWVSLALTLPKADEVWLTKFSQGFFKLAQQFSVHLIGGDTTQGPLTISLTIMGLLPLGKGLKRSAAKAGDGIYVSGQIGNGGLGLIKAIKGETNLADKELKHYLQPMPQIELGEALLPLANACIDVSDGLFADLNHILKASKVGASIEIERIPTSDAVKKHLLGQDDIYWASSAGDDYQLCFTLSAEAELNSTIKKLLNDNLITKIGTIEACLGLRVISRQGETIVFNKGYEHFNES